jgi:hypothetical protein
MKFADNPPVADAARWPSQIVPPPRRGANFKWLAAYCAIGFPTPLIRNYLGAASRANRSLRNRSKFARIFSCSRSYSLLVGFGSLKSCLARLIRQRAPERLASVV